MDNQQLTELLRTVVHPAAGTDIVTAGMVAESSAGRDGIRITLSLPKSHDPFAGSVKRQIMEQITGRDPALASKTVIAIREPETKTPEKPASTTETVNHVIAVASGKGGVGKSTVSMNLAVALNRLGYRIGLLDADIYGPSIPRMSGTEGYLPPAIREEGRDRIVPAEAYGISIMSIGYFIDPTDALIWRGPMATSALKQMIHETQWGELDYLLVDLPPGTGDVHLTLLQELKVDGAIIVSTPQQVALADVVRGIQMFRTPQIGVPVLGIVENMAWFTPAELPENRYYIFGKEGAATLAAEQQLPLLGQIPLIQSVMEGAENGHPAAAGDSEAARIYVETAQNALAELAKVTER